jgi:hypothetical protein
VRGVQGFVGGWAVWGSRSSVHEQVTLYVFARTFMTSVKMLADRGMLPRTTPVLSPFSWYAV